MPKYKHGSGSVYRRGSTWWVSYYAGSERVRESSKSKDRGEARRLLQQRLGQIAEGRFVGPQADRVTFEEMAADLFADYRANGRTSLDVTERRVKKHLARFFAGRTAHSITSTDVRAFIAARQDEGARQGEINLELAAFKRMFNLALQAEKIFRKPYLPSLQLNNARQGFFEVWQYEALLCTLPQEIRPVMTFAYWTGWRVKAEVFPLTWEQVDRETGTVRLETGTTKNKQGRVIYLTDELQALIDQQWDEHANHYPNCPFVFHRCGKRIRDIRGAWSRACKDARLEARIPHDFRRTAVRNMVRAGIPERVAMQMAGHKTRAVFDRYHIVSDTDLREAAKRLGNAFTAPNGHNFSHSPLADQSDKLLSA